MANKQSVHGAIKKAFLITAGITLFFIGIWSLIYRSGEAQPAIVQYYGKPKIIIDAGHGGFDGGAVGITGVAEKDINLSISQKLYDILSLNGFEVVMTRKDDCAINDPSEITLSRKKRSDMYNRRKIIEENPDGLFLSIHQNKFEEASSKGTQIFFSPNHPDSERLAQIFQDGFRENLQPQNHRQIKKAGEELFLLYHAKIPAIMVECGFLSNEEECFALMDDEYQSKIAFLIYINLMEYYNS